MELVFFFAKTLRAVIIEYFSCTSAEYISCTSAGGHPAFAYNNAKSSGVILSKHDFASQSVMTALLR
eukprot:9912287-Ditylum_brightwellii.AAC.1